MKWFLGSRERFKHNIMSDQHHNLPFLNKVVWITGASSGIGEALAYGLSQLGASLILSARNEDDLNQVNKQLPREPGSAKVLPLDLENLEQLPGKTDLAWSCFNKIDCFISNAGLAVRDYALNTELRIDQKLMNINYFGPTVITKRLLPHFIEQGHGHIVVMSSLSGKYGVPRLAAYAASKHALHGFFESLRSETVDQGILITMIIPGMIRTAITAHAVTGTGGTVGRIDKTFETAYPVGKAAQKIISAILKEKEEAIVGGMEVITLWLNRVSPWLLRRVIRNHPIKWLRQLKERFLFEKK